ncbi:MAG: radical SAM protein [Clostridia bacterium]|nr:radical SAM protein [Clostridia bacterium]
MKKYKKIYVEITNCCNLSCSFCPKNMREPRFMSVAEFREVNEKIRDLTDHLYFHVMGEPLLHPELEELFKIAGEFGKKVNLTTNGVLIQKVGEKLLMAESLRKVSFSLHSFEANEKECSFAEYLADIVAFVKVAAKCGILCEFRFWDGTAKEDEKITLLEKAFGHKFDGNNRICDNVFWGFGERFEWNTEKKRKVGFCYGLRDHFGILADGTVVPCCLDNEGTLALGNIFREEIHTILSSEKAKRIYDGFSGHRAVYEKCQACGFIERFGRNEG